MGKAEMTVTQKQHGVCIVCFPAGPDLLLYTAEAIEFSLVSTVTHVGWCLFSFEVSVC